MVCRQCPWAEKIMQEVKLSVSEAVSPVRGLWEDQPLGENPTQRGRCAARR